MKSFSALLDVKRTTCAKILFAALIPLTTNAAGKMDVLPKSYLPPENLSIQESIDHVLTGMEAMGTFGEMHRTLKVFRPQSDHKDLAAMFSGIEKEQIPKLRRNGLVIAIEVPGQGTLEMEVVNTEKSRFRLQGTPYTYQFTKPFIQSIAEIRGLIYKSKKTSQFSFPISLFPRAMAQFTNDKYKNDGIALKGFWEFAAGKIANAIGCPANMYCKAEAKKQEAAQPPDQIASEIRRTEDQMISTSVARKAHCDDYGKRQWPTGHTKFKACEKAIGDYRYYCTKIKANAAGYQLVFKDGSRLMEPTWSNVDCNDTFYFFAPKPQPKMKETPGRGMFGG